MWVCAGVELPSGEVLMADGLEHGKVCKLPSQEVLWADDHEPGKVSSCPRGRYSGLMSSSLARFRAALMGGTLG
jgi:hypothetical protein